MSKKVLSYENAVAEVNHIGLRGQVKWRVSPHFVH